MARIEYKNEVYMRFPQKMMYTSVMCAMMTTLVGCNDDDNTVAVVEPPQQLAPATHYRVYPYLQNPTEDAITIMWLSEDDQAVTVSVDGVGEFKSQPMMAKDLNYSPAEVAYIHGEKNFGKIFADLEQDQAPTLPYQHRIRVTGLQADTQYTYRVGSDQAEPFVAQFKTAPLPQSRSAINFVVMADMETEPESTQKTVAWAANATALGGWKLASDPSTYQRQYLVDQTQGYQQTLKYAASLAPRLWLIAGDLVEKGGRQLDWDEFWRHAAGEWGQLASSTPILPVLGNHENYWHPSEGGYSAAAARRAYDKWQSYFELPDNGASDPRHQERYYRVDYGPVSFIHLDSSNGDDSDPAKDTNLSLNGHEAQVPDFNVGSEQWRWAERQLADARSKGQIIFVQWHHMAYGTGVHSLISGTAGIANNQDSQSGLAMRVYHELMRQYGVTAVFSGHNELLETVTLDGVHYWDVGIAGDGLRGPGYVPTTDYVPFDLLPEQAQATHWSAHGDANEVWQGSRLVAGGKHYGFLHVKVEPSTAGQYRVIFEPRYSLPVSNAKGQATGEFSQEIYDHVIQVNVAAK